MSGRAPRGARELKHRVAGSGVLAERRAPRGARELKLIRFDYCFVSDCVVLREGHVN